MRTTRRPSRAAVRRALEARRTLARPPDPHKATAALGVAPEAAAEGDGEALAEAVAGLARNTDFAIVLALRWRPS